MKKVYFILATLVLSLYCASSYTQYPVIKNPKIELIATGFNFIEGPVWFEGTGLLFSDIPENKVYAFTEDSVVLTFIESSGKSNGLAIDKNGDLLLAQHYDRQIAKRNEDGTIVPVASFYNGSKLNSPNDLTVKSDGSIFFTDPPFGLNDEGRTSDLGFAGIYRISPGGDVQLLDGTLNYPNGIAFSSDESKLYVTESDIANVYVWDVVNDSTLANKTLFYDIPGQWGDGMKIDKNDFLYVTGPSGLWILKPDGTLYTQVQIPGQSSASNCGWNHDSTALYITSNNSLYRVTDEDTEQTVIILPSINKIKLDNFPNPFKNITNVIFETYKTEDIRISIMNESGQNINTLVDKQFQSGSYSISWNTSEINNGLYFIVLNCSDQKVIKTCIKNN